MVGCARGHGRGNQGQQADMAEMQHMIEDLSQVVQALQRQERMAACMENLEGDHDPIDMSEGGLEDETNMEDFDNPFPDAGAVDNVMRGRLEERLIHALYLNYGRIKIEVVDF